MQSLLQVSKLSLSFKLLILDRIARSWMYKLQASFIQFKIQIFTFSSGFLKNNDINRMIFSDVDKIS